MTMAASGRLMAMIPASLQNAVTPWQGRGEQTMRIAVTLWLLRPAVFVARSRGVAVSSGLLHANSADCHVWCCAQRLPLPVFHRPPHPGPRELSTTQVQQLLCAKHSGCINGCGG